MRAWFQRLIRRMLDRYIDPILEECRRQREQVDEQSERIEELTKGLEDARHPEWYDRLTADCAKAEERMRERLEEQDARLMEAESRERLVKESVEENSRRLSDIEHREGWTRERFEGHDRRLSDIEGREEWTRERFEGHDRRLDDQNSRIDTVDENIDLLKKAFGDLKSDQRTFAQSGEDAISAYILRFLQVPPSEITYLDLGANHARELSNTYYFYTLGARGVLVEANPELIPELERERPEDTVLNVAIGAESGGKIDFYVLNGDGLSTVSLEEAQEACRRNSELFIKSRYEVSTRTVGDILEEYFEKPPTILSVDLEGLEETVLLQTDLTKYKPWIIILENIPYTPLLSIDQREFKCAEYLENAGYTEYAFTGINSIYVLREAVEAFNNRRMSQLGEKKNE